MPININTLDHIVLTVSDIVRTSAFYRDILGMEVTTIGDDRYALVFGDQKINLHELGNEITPNAKNAIPGSADLCFISETSVEDILEFFRESGVEIVAGPVRRAGARAPITSIYIRDPDGNLLEISNQDLS